MIRSPLALRIHPDPARSPREAIREAASLGARGVVLEAGGELGPDRLSETGRREVRHLLRSTELALVALCLPTRRPLDTVDGLDDRLARADRVFAMAFELGTALVLVRHGPLPGASDAEGPRREALRHALDELARRAERHGVRLAVETGTDPGAALRAWLDLIDAPSLAASLDPGALLRGGHDPAEAARVLGSWLAHAYAHDNARHPGALDWAEYLAALEEIDYRGYLTVWPDPSAPPGPQFTALVERLGRF